MKRTKTANKTLEDAIMELYLNIENYDESYQEKEKEKLRRANPFTVIEYIKSSIEILINLKVQEKLQDKEISVNEDCFQFDDGVNEYEKLLRKLESDIRTYIKIEHQLKLHSENLQQRVEELEKQKDDYKMKYKKMQEQYNKIKSTEKVYNNEEEMNQYKKEISQLQQIVKTYEEHNLKIPELEKKLRLQKTKFEKEIKTMEDNYQNKIKTLSSTSTINKNEKNDKFKTITNYEEKLEEDLDRVNYNTNSNKNNTQRNKNVTSPLLIQHQRTQSIKERDRSRSQSFDLKQNTTLTSRKNNAILNNYETKSTDRKKEIDYISTKINQYKKGIDNKNIKNVMEDIKVKKDVNHNNKSALESNRTLEISKLITNRKNDLSTISNRSIRGHSRDISNPNIKIPQSKTIHALKDNLKINEKDNRLKSKNQMSHITAAIKENVNTSHYNTNSHTPNNNFNSKLQNNNSNIILNQHGVPCYNNIHIYTNGIKSNDINLRNIFNKKLNTNGNSKTNNNTSITNPNKSGYHGRSNSSIGH